MVRRLDKSPQIVEREGDGYAAGCPNAVPTGQDVNYT